MNPLMVEDLKYGENVLERKGGQMRSFVLSVCYEFELVNGKEDAVAAVQSGRERVLNVCVWFGKNHCTEGVVQEWWLLAKVVVESWSYVTPPPP